MYSPQLVSPIIKQYSINNAPFLESTNLKTGIIREDVLPAQLTANTTNTLGERLNIHNFVRSVFIKTYDGEDIDIDGQGTNSILRYLKFLELNPYCPTTNMENPYMGMPTDMLLYKSCYPIVYDNKTNSLQCSNNALGMNVRIYTLSFAEYNIKKINGHNFYEYDIWREMAYYEYIRENVLKKKVCPNFILLHCYYISENCNIDRNKILLLKGKSSKRYGPYILFLIKQLNIYKDQVHKTIDHINTNVPPFIGTTEIKWFEKEMYNLQMRYKELKCLELALAEQQQLHQTDKLFEQIQNDLKDLLNAYKAKTTLPQTSNINTNVSTITVHPLVGRDAVQPLVGPKMALPPHIPHGLMTTLYDFCGKGLVAMTESPTYNFYDWASVKYEAQGNIHKMINTGFHTVDVWLSVLFQIMASLYTLQKHKIAFKDFSIGDNIYIKDITVHNNITKYWKYIIDSHEYYVPNYGYLVLFDTNYKDVDDSTTTLIPSKDTKYHKIYSNIFKDGIYDDNKIHDLCFDAFANTFTINNFTISFSLSGGSSVPDLVKQLFGKITTDLSNKPSNDVGFYIQKHMRQFLNNRIGTLLLETELKFIDPSNKDFKKGEIIVEEISAGTYRFVLYVGHTNTPGMINVLYKKDPKDTDIIDNVINISSLNKYSQYEPVTQNFKAGSVTFSEDNLLETYIC